MTSDESFEAFRMLFDVQRMADELYVRELNGDSPTRAERIAYHESKVVAIERAVELYPTVAETLEEAKEELQALKREEVSE
jgi:hypothetical protein